MADPLAGVDGHIQENLCHDVIKEALESGRDLREYSRSVDQQLKGTEDEAIKDYMENCKDIAALHNEIASCDGILQRMENILRGFQVYARTCIRPRSKPCSKREQSEIVSGTLFLSE